MQGDRVDVAIGVEGIGGHGAGDALPEVFCGQARLGFLEEGEGLLWFAAAEQAAGLVHGIGVGLLIGLFLEEHLVGDVAEVVGPNRLVEEVDRSEAEAVEGDAVVDLGAGDDGGDGQIVCGEVGEHPDAVDARHAEVEDHEVEVGVLVLKFGEGLLTVAGQIHEVAFREEGEAEAHAEGGFVVHHQDAEIRGRVIGVELELVIGHGMLRRWADRSRRWWIRLALI